MSKIKVLIADDHGLVRHGLSSYLMLSNDVAVVGEAVNGSDAVQKVEQLQPDIVLMDIVMPEMDGIEATRRIRAHQPKTQVIALTSFVEDEKIFAAIEAGATSYLLKDIDPADLIQSIIDVHEGKSHLHPKVTRKLVEQVAKGKITNTGQLTEANLLLDALTERELEVLKLIADGKSNQQICDELVISLGTAKKHVSNILSKLQTNNRTEAAAQARNQGLI